jgi:hypothetical protein
MSGGSDQEATGGSDREPVGGGFAPSRRAVLVIGAAAASTVITVRPALAQTAGSVLNCEIPIPQPAAGGSYIAPDGTLVAPGTQGAAAPLGRPLRGEEVKALLRSGTVPAGVDPTSAQAYANYIRRLQAGMSGFTCYASLQMPR